MEKKRTKLSRILVIETEIDHSVEIEKDKTLDLTIEDNHKIDIHKVNMTIREEPIDAKIMVLGGDSRDRGGVNFRRDFSNDRNDSRDGNRNRTRGRSLTPRRNDRRYHSPNVNLGTRNRSASRFRMNIERIRCYKCK